jgi:uncharacterized membrane protein
MVFIASLSSHDEVTNRVNRTLQAAAHDVDRDKIEWTIRSEFARGGRLGKWSVAKGRRHMELLVGLLLVGIPLTAVAGLITVIVVAVRTSDLKKRVAELENQRSIGPKHPISRMIRDLQDRVAALEGQPADEEVSPAPGPMQPDEPAVPPPVETVTATPPSPPAEEMPASATQDIAEPEPLEATPPAPAAEAPPPTPPKAARPRIEWERWIGVRGAAAAGGIVLALAALLFFQYSIEHGLISPAMRVVMGVIAGICCLVGSEWLIKRDQAAAANALSGAGVVILYGATWAAQNLYGLIGTVPAFMLMVLITIVCVVLAVSRSAPFVAVLGLLGGFATPILVASEVDSPAALFGYILLLDLGLLWLARARGWPLLAILSLVGTALHQAIWIFESMDAERAGLGLAILAVFGLVFLLVGRRDREQSLLWKATRAGGVAIPFAFGLHFAGTAQLAENPWPLGVLLLILSAGACWLARRETPDVAVAAAGASLGIMALWFLNHRVSPALAWQAMALCVALAALFAIAAEISRSHPSADRLGLAALISHLGFLALLVFAATESRVVKPWPWLVGWAALGGLLILHSRSPGRAWVQIAAGLGPALGFIVSIENYGPSAIGLESWAWLGLIVFVAIVFQVLAVLTKDETRYVWAERTAAATAIALMAAASWVSSADRSASLSSIAAVLILGILAILSATRSRSGSWYLVTTAAAAFWQTIVYLDVHQHSSLAGASESAFWLMLLSAVIFTVWPALVSGAFRDSRSAWWAAALAGPVWFVALKAAFIESFGDRAIGLLPVALAVIALVTVLWLRPRLAGQPDTRRTALVWYLAATLSLVSVAIPLQLDKEWVTIGWALNGLAILALWVRLPHPGLKYFGLALLGAATVRLIANPEVLNYHLRAAVPILNWISYTYLVPAAALISSGRILKAWEVGRLEEWEDRLYPAQHPIAGASCGLAAVAVIFVWINLAIADLFASGPSLELSFQRLPARDATTSVAWALYALVLLAIGVRSRSSSLRWLSLGLLVVTLGKVFLHDLGELEDLYRVGSLVGLALSLIIVSLIYQRFVFRSEPEEDL